MKPGGDGKHLWEVSGTLPYSYIAAVSSNYRHRWRQPPGAAQALFHPEQVVAHTWDMLSSLSPPVRSLKPPAGQQGPACTELGQRALEGHGAGAVPSTDSAGKPSLSHLPGEGGKPPVHHSLPHTTGISRCSSHLAAQELRLQSCCWGITVRNSKREP